MKYKMLVIICLIICVFTISTACAGEIENETYELEAADNVIVESNYDNYGGDLNNAENGDKDLLTDYNDSVLSSNTYSFTDLKEDINNCNGVLNLQHNYYYKSGDGEAYLYGIKIDSKVTINGNGYTIDGKSLARIFLITGNNVVLNNINFNNGAGGQGGAICWEGENGKVTNCNFNNNKLTNTIGYHGGTNSGGAIFWRGNYGTIESCTFTKNYAKNGGAINWFGSNGKVINCKFISNEATDNGGALFVSRNIRIGDTTSFNKYCTFEGNSAMNGGAIYIEGYQTTIFEDNRFNSNTAKNGGAIYIAGNDNLLKNSVFNENMASENGGAIYCFGDNNNMTIRAQNNSANRGGAIFWDTMTNGKVIFKSCSGNNAKLGDNVFLNKGKITISNSSLLYKYNATLADLQADIENIYYLTLGRNYYFSADTDSNLINGIDLKLIYLIDGNGYVIDGKNCASIFTANNKNYPVNLTNIHFKNCLPLIFNNTAVNIFNCTFENCTESEFGGTIVILNPKDDVASVNKCTFINTSSNYQIIKQSVIENNSSNNNSSNAPVDTTDNTNTKSTTNAKSIKKTTPKLTAKAKTFKKKVKTKKYVVTLKTNKNKPIKKVKLTLKVKGKTYKATTNSKGKATFKITKLTKKGTFKAVVTYKGDNYYNRVTKTVKIKVK